MKISSLFKSLSTQTPQMMVSGLLFDPQGETQVCYQAEKTETGKYDILKITFTKDHFAHSLELLHGAASWTPALPAALAVKVLEDFETATLSRGGYIFPAVFLSETLAKQQKESHFSRYSHLKAWLPVYKARVAIDKMFQRLG